MEILVLGGVSYDTLIHIKDLPKDHQDTLFAHHVYHAVGSTGSGKALALKKLGFKVTLHGVIGQDQPGEIIKQTMRESNIRFLDDLTPLGTETHTNLMDDFGNRISIFTNTFENEPSINLEAIRLAIQKADIVVLNIINYCRHLIPMIRSMNKPIWVDIHDYDGTNPYHQDFIDASDVLFMSSDKITDLKGFMHLMIDKGKQFVVATHGSAGSTMMTSSHQILNQAIIPAKKLIDSNGAGDNFFAGFLYAYSKAYSFEKCLLAGAYAGKTSVEYFELVHPSLSASVLDQVIQSKENI